MRSEGKSFALAFLIGLSATPMTGAPAQPPAAEHGFVVRVSDGDTILVNLHGHLEKVRLIGVDTPEIGREDLRTVRPRGGTVYTPHGRA